MKCDAPSGVIAGLDPRLSGLAMPIVTTSRATIIGRHGRLHAGHPRLSCDVEARRGWRRKSVVPDFRTIKRDRKSETSNLRATSPAMTWKEQTQVL
jgi:hypothetical protein